MKTKMVNVVLFGLNVWSFVAFFIFYFFFYCKLLNVWFCVSSCVQEPRPESVGSSSLRLSEWRDGEQCGVGALCCPQPAHHHRRQTLELGWVMLHTAFCYDVVLFFIYYYSLNKSNKRLIFFMLVFLIKLLRIHKCLSERSATACTGCGLNTAGAWSQCFVSRKI